jgi:hypothetical protein
MNLSSLRKDDRIQEISANEKLAQIAAEKDII